MQGYVAVTFHLVVDDRLVHGLFAMHQIVKGDEGHTAVRLAAEILSVFRDAVRLVLLDDAARRRSMLTSRDVTTMTTRRAFVCASVCVFSLIQQWV